MRRPQKAETGVQREIKAALEMAGYIVRRIHSGKVKVSGGWMQLAETGTPDLLVIGRGWMGLCEVKTEDGELSPEQVDFSREMFKRGVGWFIARSPVEAVTKANELAARRAA
jgi:hypothetical protein